MRATEKYTFKASDKQEVEHNLFLKQDKDMTRSLKYNDSLAKAFP